MKYMKAMMETAELEVEEVVLTSGGTPCNEDDCMLHGVDCDLMG